MGAKDSKFLFISRPCGAMVAQQEKVKSFFGGMKVDRVVKHVLFVRLLLLEL